jgi:hypothetical protein
MVTVWLVPGYPKRCLATEDSNGKVHPERQHVVTCPRGHRVWPNASTPPFTLASLGIFVGSYRCSVIHAAFEEVNGMPFATAGLTARAPVLLCRWFRYNPWNNPS